MPKYEKWLAVEKVIATRYMFKQTQSLSNASLFSKKYAYHNS